RGAPRRHDHPALLPAPARLLRDRRGSVTLKCAPFELASTSIRPPCASANSRAIASPSPVPSIRPLALARPRKNESKIASRSSAGTPGPESMTSMTASPPLARAERDRSACRRELHRVADEVVDDGKKLFAVDLDRELVELERQALRLRLHDQLMRPHRVADQAVERQRLRCERRGGVQRPLVVEQVLDQALQLHAVVAHDRHDLALGRRERAADLIVEQLGALAERGKGGFQLVREMAQEAVLFGLQLGEPPPQPVEALAQRLE